MTRLTAHSEAQPSTPGGATGDLASPVAAVRIESISKRFGSVTACDSVDLEVRRGQIHGLLGQNGAGKSTLMKILLGLLTPDAGRILINGRPVVVKDPLAAAAMGIAMVHQHFSVIGALTVWENVTLGETTRLDAKESIRHVETLSERYGLDVDPVATLNTLTPGQRQRVEIIKCLQRNPNILVLDEPTSVLTMAESEALFNTLRVVVGEEGRAVILISHKLDEILHATDEVTIMRDGRVVETAVTSETDAASLARGMVGRTVALRSESAALGHIVDDAANRGQDDSAATAPVQLRISDARHVASDGRVLLDGLSLEVRRGEILGLAGVEGNGQGALEALMSSLIDLERGTVEVGGETIRTGKPGTMARVGVAVIPEDRHVSGCVLGMSVAENLVLNDVGSVCRRRILSTRLMREHAQRLIEQFDIKTPSFDTLMSSLSGGNQQRVVLARALSCEPSVLIAAQPTHGLDVGAIEYMSAQLKAIAESGVAVLLISTELDEIFSMSDRIAVIHRGRIVGEMDRRDADLERVGLLMGGSAV